LLWFALAATVLLADQYSKLWIMERYAYGEGEFFTSFLIWFAPITMVLPLAF
jgi:lipoprotein signal peptidase